MANSTSKLLWNGLSGLGVATVANFALQCTGFVAAWTLKTEKFYDLLGSAANIVVPSVVFYMSGQQTSTIACVQYGCVVLWAARLGSFLVYRIMRDGKDRRFDKIKVDFKKFMAAWTIQGIWVSLITLPTCSLFQYSNTIGRTPSIGHYIGWGLFGLGFLLETIADHQKLTFKGNSANEDKFIQSGLWSLSRHPNYLGEITLWWGLYISAVTSSKCRFMKGSLSIGPLFVTYLLGSFSLNMLERSSEKRYGNLPGYLDYKQRTRKLIPYLY